LELLQLIVGGIAQGCVYGPSLSCGPDRHQGSTATFLAKVVGGRWKVIAENLLC